MSLENNPSVNAPQSKSYSGESSTEEILDLLNEPSADEPEEKEVKVRAPKKEAEVEVEEPEEPEGTEEETEEESEAEAKPDLEQLQSDDEDEEVTPEAEDEIVFPIRLKELSTKYPNILKEFPDIKRLFFHRKNFHEHFESIDDAVEAKEKAQVFDQYQQVVLNGDTETILKTIKDNDPKAFAGTVDKYLGTLAKVDERAFHHVMNLAARNIVLGMVNKARMESDENLQNAAMVLNQFMTGSVQFQNLQPFGNNGEVRQEPVKEEKNSLQKEREAFEAQRFQTVFTDVATSAQKAIRSTIATNIDPKGVMPPFVKKHAINECMTELETLLQRDSGLSHVMNDLWRDARKKNYDHNSLGKIRAAYLSRVKKSIGSIIQKQRTEALKGLGRTKSSDTEDRQGIIPAGRSASSTQSRKDASTMKPGETIEEFFARD